MLREERALSRLRVVGAREALASRVAPLAGVIQLAERRSAACGKARNMKTIIKGVPASEEQRREAVTKAQKAIEEAKQWKRWRALQAEMASKPTTKLQLGGAK